MKALGSSCSGLAAENGKVQMHFLPAFELIWGLIDHLNQCSAPCFWSLGSTETTSMTLESNRYRWFGHSLCLTMLQRSLVGVFCVSLRESHEIWTVFEQAGSSIFPIFLRNRQVRLKGHR